MCDVFISYLCWILFVYALNTFSIWLEYEMKELGNWYESDLDSYRVRNDKKRQICGIFFAFMMN